jgi:hypothetical protein
MKNKQLLLFPSYQTFGKTYIKGYSYEYMAHFTHLKHFGRLRIFVSFTSSQNKFQKWDRYVYWLAAPLHISGMINDVWRKNTEALDSNISQPVPVDRSSPLNAEIYTGLTRRKNLTWRGTFFLLPHMQQRGLCCKLTYEDCVRTVKFLNSWRSQMAVIRL